MADTQTLVIFLAKSLPDPVKGYTLYLDNLFPSDPLAVELGKLGIGVMSTARFNTLGLSSSLIELKHAEMGGSGQAPGRQPIPRQGRQTKRMRE